MYKLQLFLLRATILCIVHCILHIYPGFANDCLKYKTVPSLEIEVPNHKVSVVQPDVKMDMMHGNVVSTFAEEYEINYGAENISEGWCVFINTINATIGYTDFVVQINKNHNKDNCEFAAILEHEDEHIRAHLSVVEDEMTDIKNAVRNAADNVLPVFVKTEGEIDGAMEKLESILQARPEIKLLRQKLAAEQEIRNKKIDMNDRGERVRECAERFDNWQ